LFISDVSGVVARGQMGNWREQIRDGAIFPNFSLSENFLFVEKLVFQNTKKMGLKIPHFGKI